MTREERIRARLRLSWATPPGARLAYEDEKGRAFFETFDEAKGARAVPFFATRDVPWSEDARARFERLVSKRRDDDDGDDGDDGAASASASAEEARGAGLESSDESATSLTAYLAELGASDGFFARDRLGDVSDKKRRRKRAAVPEPGDGRVTRDETRDASGRQEGPADAAASSRVARTLAALAPEIRLETSFAETGRFFDPDGKRAFFFRERRRERGSARNEKIPRASRTDVFAESTNIARVLGLVEVRDETARARGDARVGDGLRLAALVAAESAFERRHTLRSILAGTPEALAGDAQKRLVCFQMAAGVAEAHEKGLTFGGRLDAGDVLVRGAPASPRVELDPVELWVNSLENDDAASSAAPPLSNSDASLASATEAWCVGAMSTLDYLLVVNARAGRFRGRRDRHAVVPWVADFSEPPDAMLRDASPDVDEPDFWRPKPGWRDLSKTKWRLTKGDAQLDFSFANASPPHHVSDECLCETTTCVYLARATPVSELRRRVRRRFAAREYPSAVERIYAWSPDEAIPQFYDDPSVFHSDTSSGNQSVLGGSAVSPEESLIGDLRVPSRRGWGDDAAAFVKKHRALLESDFVSARLPKWIDLTFGVALFGERAAAEKNVMVPAADPTRPNANARVAVFFHPHPPRAASRGGRVPRSVAAVFPLFLKTKKARFPVREAEDATIASAFGRADDPTAPALTGSDPISLSGTPYVDPDALARALAPGPHVFARDAAKESLAESSPNRDAASSAFSVSKRKDSARLGRLFAAVYADGGASARRTGRDARARLVMDPTHPVDVHALPHAARAIVEGLLRSEEQDGGSRDAAPVRDAGLDAAGGAASGASRGLTAAAARDSSFFSPSIRAAAAALSILHGGAEGDPISGDASPLTTLRAARAALASCASDVEATALVAPAAAEAAREAIQKFSVRPFCRSRRWARNVSRLIGSVALRVARRAPKAVARGALPPLFRDALAGAADGDEVEDEDGDGDGDGDGDDDSDADSDSDSDCDFDSESERDSDGSASSSSASTSSAPGSKTGSPRSKKNQKKTRDARDVLRREMLRPAVLRAARVALGDAAYAATIRDARVFALLRPDGASRKTARAAARALAAEACASETPLPIAVREIVYRGLLSRLHYGAPVAFAMARVGESLGPANFTRFVAPALVRALGADAHLATVASAAARAAARGRDEADDLVTPAAAVAAAESSACKGGWSLAPFSARRMTEKKNAPLAANAFARQSGAAASLASSLHLFDKETLLELLFPAFPAPPGPLLRILLQPAPCLDLCVAAARLAAAAADRILAPDDAFARALPRLKPLFAVACQASPREEEDAAALTLAFALYPALGRKTGFRALRDAVPDAPALEARFAARFRGWTAETGASASASAAGLASRSSLSEPFETSAQKRFSRNALSGSENRRRGYGWLPAPDARELDAEEARRVGTTLDDDRDDAPDAFDDGGDDTPWALRLETLRAWRAHPPMGPSRTRASFGDDGERMTRGASPSAERLMRSKSGETNRRLHHSHAVSATGVCATASSADERWLATCGLETGKKQSVVKVWSAGGPSAGVRDGDVSRDGDDVDVVDAPAACFATHDAHEGGVTCLAFLDGVGTGSGGVSLAASADDSGAAHVWRADTGALLFRVCEPEGLAPGGGNAGGFRFAGSREAAAGGWEARARAIERRTRIAAAILEETRDAGLGDDDGDDANGRVFSSDDDDEGALASSDTLLDELSGPELGDLIGDDVVREPRRRRAADASEPSFRVSSAAPAPASASPRAASLFGYGASEMFSLGSARARANDSIAGSAAGAVGDGGWNRANARSPGRSTGYACLAPTPDASSLALGTADGWVRLVDVARERLAGSWLCKAGDGTSASASDGIASVCFPGAESQKNGVVGGCALACAGARSGAVSFMDRRGGRLVAGFRAHDGAVVAMAALDGAGSLSHGAAPCSLVTASRDGTVRAWDARMLTSSGFAPNGDKNKNAQDPSGGSRKTPLLCTFGGFGDGVRGMALRGADAFVVAGERLAVFSLDDRPPRSGPGDAAAKYATGVGETNSRVYVAVSPLRLRAHDGAEAKARARLTGVEVLPRSRLFAVAGEDGIVRVCR